MSQSTERSEWIEIEALRAVYDFAPDQVKQSLGLVFENIGCVTCLVSSVEPSILINRCFGLGKHQPAEPLVIHAVKQFYRDAGVGEFFLHLTPESQPANIRELLKQAGMVQSRGWMKFTRDILPATPGNPDLETRKIGPEHAEDFARIVAPCFDMTNTSMPLLASIVHHPDYHLYMGFDGDTSAATGALFVKSGIGYYDWAATHRDFRSRGFQGAVLVYLINDAIRLGCERLVTCTGEEVPGDPQHSYKNILRYGFIEDYLRENWVPSL